MKLASWACCAISLVCVWAAGPSRASDNAEPAPLLRFDSANKMVVPIGPELQAPGVLRPDVYEPGWSPVTLPESRGRAPYRAEDAASPRWQMDWYHVRYVLPPRGASPPLAVYVPRVQGGPAEVYVNGRLLASNLDDWSTQWNRPLFVPMPHDVVFTNPASDVEVDVVVGLPWHAGLSHAMSRITVGPAHEIRPAYDRRMMLQVIAPQVTSLTILVLGLFSFGFWWRRRHESAYLLFALTSVVWWFRNLHYHIQLPDPGPASDWFWWATHASLAWLMVLNYLFAFRFHQRRFPAVEWGLAAFTVVSALATLPMLPWDGLMVQHVFNVAVSLFVTGFISWIAAREGSRELSALAIALAIGIALGIHDLLLLSLRISPESVYLLPYGALLVFAAFLYAVLRRYAGAVEEVARANISLELRLAERTSELELNHRRLRDVEREQAMLVERQRLMRDMHDGMGSTLMSSLVLVEQGRLDIRGVAAVLRECVDDLRLVIDSLEPIGNDIVTLLATLRYRLGRRLEAAGLVMEWNVADLPPLQWLDATAALQVLRIVQETLTNTLKHARAHSVRITVRGDGQHVEVCVSDDGQGFDVEAMARGGEGGRGLRNLRRRARTLGGDVQISSRPGYTCVTLLLPIDRAEPVPDAESGEYERVPAKSRS